MYQHNRLSYIPITSLLRSIPLRCGTLPSGAGEMQRYDETSDFLFYSQPRFVTHIDDAAGPNPLLLFQLNF